MLQCGMGRAKLAATSGDPKVRIRATYGLAECYAGLYQFDEAIKALRAIKDAAEQTDVARRVAEMEQQKREGTRLLKIIIDKNFVTEQDMAVSMGRVLNTPPVNLGRLAILPEIGELLPRDICHTHKVLPVSRLENKLFLMAEEATPARWASTQPSPFTTARTRATF